MLNVICVKIGTKYDSHYVNRLLKMCRACISEPFTFFCYTDDKTGIDSSVVCIDFVDHEISTIVFNKLYLLSDEFASKHLHNDKCVFFDLDIVLRWSVDFLFDNWTEDLRVIHTSWKDDYYVAIGSPHFIHDINSSCMTWQPFHTNKYWQMFMKNKQYFLQTYNGMDQYLYFSMGVRGSLPDKFQSHLYGFTAALMPQFMNKDGALVFAGTNTPTTIYPICLLNGNTTFEDYMRNYKEYYAD